MEAVLEYNSTKAKINISKINSLEEFINKVKLLLKIEPNKEIEVYILPEKTFLKETNFEDEFLKRKKQIKGFSVYDVIDLGEKIKNIGLGNDTVPTNHIEEDNDLDKNESESIILDKHQIFKDKCILCQHSFNQCKFGCLLCPNYFLCSKCEENHPHPMIKYKSINLSDNVNKLITIYSYSNKKEKDYQDAIKRRLRVKNICQVQTRTNIASNSFLMGSSQERMLNFLIKNNNKFDIQKNTLSIIIKNQYDLNVTIKDELLFNDLKAGMEIPIGLYIRSNAKNLLKKYCLRIEVVSNNLDILSKPIDLKIEVKDDQEDNELNKQFNEFPSIILLPKEKKKKLQYIIKEKISIKTPQEIKAIMERFKWSIDEAIVDLTN